ncbi:MAG: xylulokinase [Clostridia bacterium]|nr:xylulokinase [Clostridia bacterium]
MKNFIGIDLGTSGVKILLVDANGKILSEVSESYSVMYPKSGWAEQNPEDWYSAVLRGLKRLNASGVSGIACGGQMHGLVVLDGEDNVIRPCILWNDGRTGREVELLNDVIGCGKLTANTGNIAFAGFTAPKLLWLKHNEPENFKRISKIMLPKDYIVYRLTGQFVTDYSDASGTLLLDVKNKRWSRTMLDICGISGGQLPKLCESYQNIGTVKREISDLLGWGEVTVAAGAGDNAAAAVGTGTVGVGGCNISLGTSGTVFISSDRFTLPQNNALHSFAHADGRFHLMGCILSAASANKWWIEDILGANYDLPEKIRQYQGKNEVYFLPYLMGERCPHNDVKARGAFIGMTPETTKEQMSLAVLEGVAFAFRDCLELSGITVKTSTVCGGGAKSGLWPEILSNVLNLELQAVETGQGPAFGAAVLAMVACGIYPDVEAATGLIVKKHTVAKPDKRTVEAYNERYEKFKMLYPALKNCF